MQYALLPDEHAVLVGVVVIPATVPPTYMILMSGKLKLKKMFFLYFL